MALCEFKIFSRDPTGVMLERQCMLDSGHEAPHPMDGMKGRVTQGSKPHEIASICEECGHVNRAWPGSKKNEKWTGTTQNPKKVEDEKERKKA